MKPKRKSSHAKQLAVLFRALAQPARLRILAAIGYGEACVCHLEADLGYRQAYISQHLMALREAGLVNARRDGRNIYYSLTDTDLIALIKQSAALAGLPLDGLQFAEPGVILAGCPCPRCESELITLEVR